MLTVDPVWLLGINLLIAVGYYTILTAFLTRDFSQRFGRFRGAYDNWLRGEENVMRDNLRELVDGGDPEQWSDALAEWTARVNMARKPVGEYNSLNGLMRWILALSFLGAVAAAWEILSPSPTTSPYFSALDASFLLTLFSIAVVFYHLWKHLSLTGRIAKYETGTPIDEFVRQELGGPEED